jgi:hypothetical protein
MGKARGFLTNIPQADQKFITQASANINVSVYLGLPQGPAFPNTVGVWCAEEPTVDLTAFWMEYDRLRREAK